MGEYVFLRNCESPILKRTNNRIYGSNAKCSDDANCVATGINDQFKCVCKDSFDGDGLTCKGISVLFKRPLVNKLLYYFSILVVN